MTALGNAFDETPVNIYKYHSTDNLAEILRFVEGKSFDVVHVDHLHMAYYGLAVGKVLGIPVALREHNLELKIMKRFAETAGNPLHRAYAAVQVSKFKRYEPKICATVDKCIMITEEDKKALLSYRKDVDAVVIPAGVDTEYFSFVGGGGEENAIAYVGSLDWLPNIDGLKWFVREVMPRIVSANPGAKFYIYGKNPLPAVRKLDDGKNVIVKGFVDDVREVYRKARVLVVPLLAGSGMRIKILEAMAAGKAIVTTRIGSEGITCESGKNILVADRPTEFAEDVLRLLNNGLIRETIGREASTFATREYSWDSIGLRFWDTYVSLIEDHRKKRNQS